MVPASPDDKVRARNLAESGAAYYNSYLTSFLPQLMRCKASRPILMLCLTVVVTVFSFYSAAAQRSNDKELWRDVEVIRTAHGVPHIRAKNLRAAGYALAWVMLEDYGQTAAMDLLESSGRWATVEGYQRVESDLFVQRERDKTAKNYPRLPKDVRDVYEGFAVGANRYIQQFPGKFPSQMPYDFRGIDAASIETIPPSLRKIRLFLNRMNPQPNTQQPPAASAEGEGPDDGSNAWAFAPSRTKSGKAILLRNPHLLWNAGYYEAHITVPGVVDFYGDFRIGGPFTVIGGFNIDLGWSTTNNTQDLDEFYALDVDPKNADHYLIDAKSVALTRELRTVTFRNGEGDRPRRAI